jgi:hypothetical protein
VQEEIYSRDHQAETAAQFDTHLRRDAEALYSNDSLGHSLEFPLLCQIASSLANGGQWNWLGAAHSNDPLGFQRLCTHSALSVCNELNSTLNISACLHESKIATTETQWQCVLLALTLPPPPTHLISPI